MNKKNYELRAVKHVHEKDVRTVTNIPGKSGFVTGSRDKLAKLFLEDVNSKNFELFQVYNNAKHFISNVFVMSNEQDELLVYVGSNDSNIYVYKTVSNQLQFKLTGHDLTVCSINGESNTKKLITGSWDKTARIWESDLEIAKLEGHLGAVWATLFLNEKTALTGSADKTIKIWNALSYKCIKTIDAHSDCVRDLRKIDDNNFLSCSNDCTIKQWNIKGECIKTFDGHLNYVYSITIINNDLNNLVFASCSEDKTLRVWNNNENIQSIRVPSQTLWSVCTLQNKDLVVGCSNGNIYIYTQNEKLFASEDIREKINQEVSSTNLQMSELGDIKVDKLPDFSTLSQPGKKEGEVKIVKENNSVLAYQWSSAKFEWIKIGDVVGTKNSNNDPSQKKEYEGKFYDFVFSVDIQDGVPPLKLPYNVDQNPYVVAQQFIDKNELSQSYLDEIANFIVKNSSGGNSMQIGEQKPVNSDPFTGKSSYQPTSSQQIVKGNETNDYFPLTNYFFFENINLEGITKKLKEFKSQVDDDLKISSDDIKLLLKLTDLNQTDISEQIKILEKMIKWPQINLFPVLDFIRMAILLPNICDALCLNSSSNNFLTILLDSIENQNSMPNQYLGLRCLCNLFKNENGQKLIKNYDQIILNKISSCLTSYNKNVQVSLSTLYMNFALFLCKKNDKEISIITELALNSIQLLQDQFDSEAQFRALVTLGTIIEFDKQIISLIKSEDFFKLLDKLSNNQVEKLNKCAVLIKKKFI